METSSSWKSSKRSLKDSEKLIPILKVHEEFTAGSLVNRPNRFTLLVDVKGAVKKTYLANPGRLSTVIEKGREILLIKRGGERRTDYDAFAIRIGPFYVTVESRFANEIFKAIVRKGLLKDFEGFEIIEEERLMKGYGRIDFVLSKDERRVLVEVKSCTHVENGIAKFPDRPTERGRRHVRMLIELKKRGEDCCLIFIIQRPDAVKFSPFHEVDPEFAQLTKLAKDLGVKIIALTTDFDPLTSTVFLVKSSLPIVF